MTTTKHASHPKLERAPLIYMLAQVRFSPVLKMSESVPDIQEAFRKSGYPLYETDQVQDISLGASGYVVEPKPRWVFLNAHRTEGILLTNSFVTFETVSYETFEQFQPKMAHVLDVVNKTVEVGIKERLGLRYVNLLQKDEDASAIDCLEHGLRGARFDNGFTMLCQQYALQCKTKHGNLWVRINQNPEQEKGPLPPDLLASKLKVVKTTRDSSAVLLDIDHFSSEEEQFDPKKINDLLPDLHDGIWAAFTKTITREALNRWEGGEKS